MILFSFIHSLPLLSCALEIKPRCSISIYFFISEAFTRAIKQSRGTTGSKRLKQVTPRGPAVVSHKLFISSHRYHPSAIIYLFMFLFSFTFAPQQLFQKARCPAPAGHTRGWPTRSHFPAQPVNSGSLWESEVRVRRKQSSSSMRMRNQPLTWV